MMMWSLCSRKNDFLNSTTLYDSSDTLDDELNKVGDAVFYISAVLIALMGIFCTIGNGLVLYISNKNQDFGGFREVNWVVKNLAMSDCLFGVFGCPLTIVWWYWGKNYRVKTMLWCLINKNSFKEFLIIRPLFWFRPIWYYGQFCNW